MRRSLEAGIAVVALLVIGYFLFLRGGDVDGSKARRLVEGGALLVDVRTPEEFTAAHLPGAVNIPVQELDRRMGELGPREKPVVLYCRSGSRSARAARMLEAAGYSTVHDLGAMSRW
jgi:rhodanese-related sulfurtransferase